MRSLKDYEQLLSQIMVWIARDTRFRCRPGLGQILSENPRLVVAMSHASPLSWIPAVALLTAHATARGGGDRVPLGVMDRFFYSTPIVKHLAQLLTQTDQPLTFSQLLTSFGRGEGNDLVVFPEGSNCFFGDPGVLQPFRSARFAEIAIRSGAPVLVCAHRGSEAWGKPIKIESEWLGAIDFLPKIASDFLESRLKRSGVLTLPMWPQPMEKFDMLCEMVVPEVSAEDLSDDPEIRKTQIQGEADRVRAKMLALLNELDGNAVSAREPDTAITAPGRS